MVVSRRTACLLAAVAVFAVFALASFGAIGVTHPFGLLGVGLVALAAAFV